MKRIRISLIWAAIIAVLCLSPSEKLPDSSWIRFENLDKIVHFLLYFVWACIAFLPLRKYLNSCLSLKWWLPIMILFGVAIEFLQEYLFLGRSFEYFDIIANISGTIVGLFISYLLKIKIKSNEC